MLHKTFIAGLLLSVAFVPQAFAGFEFVSPVAPVVASQQAKPDKFVSAPIAEAPKVIPTVTPATPTAPKMQGLMKPANVVLAVKADESDALLLSDEVLAEPSKAVAPILPPVSMVPTLPATPTVATIKNTPPAIKPVPVSLPAAVVPKVASGAALPPVVQADMPVAKAAPVTYQVIQGFGKQVPLALALRQIVPADYRFSFAAGVNAGQMVDWQGGAPWDQVVSRVATENALLVRITNQVVLIEQNPNSAKAPALSAIMPSSVAPALPPLVTVNKTKKAPAFAGDNPLVLALGETLPTRDTEDMSLNQPRRSFQKPISLMASLPVSAVVKAAALPTALVPVATTTPVVTSPTPAPMPAPPQPVAALPTNTMLAQKAMQPSLAPMAVPSKPVLDKLPPTLPPLPKARSIDVAEKPVPAAAVRMPVQAIAKPVVKPTVLMPVADLVETTTKDNNNLKSMVKPTVANQLPQLRAVDIKPTPVMPMPTLGTPKMPMAVETANAVQQTWVAEKGQTMRQAFAAWAPDAGVTLIWSAAYDYPLQTDVAINGTFQDAVRTMLDGFSKAQPRPVGRLHKNGATGNAVLVVETRQATE